MYGYHLRNVGELESLQTQEVFDCHSSCNMILNIRVVLLHVLISMILGYVTKLILSTILGSSYIEK